MKIHGLLTGCMGLLVMTSCSSVRKMSAKDSPVTTTMTKKPKNTQREFLNMEVTPGGQPASGTAMVSRNKPSANNTTKYTAPQTPQPYQPVNGSTDIESSHMLQLKYAVAMDATVEKLTNLSLLQVIDKWWGTRYCMGGSTDNCIDCSGFTQIVLRDVYNRPLPRTALEQYNTSEKIGLEDLREGDLVFFHTTGKDVSHVGVYLLNNKFVHASTSNGVMISDLDELYFKKRYVGSVRVR